MYKRSCISNRMTQSINNKLHWNVMKWHAGEKQRLCQKWHPRFSGQNSQMKARCNVLFCPSDQAVWSVDKKTCWWNILDMQSLIYLSKHVNPSICGGIIGYYPHITFPLIQRQTEDGYTTHIRQDHDSERKHDRRRYLLFKWVKRSFSSLNFLKIHFIYIIDN